MMKLLLSHCVALLLVIATGTVHAEEPLMPEEAFRFDAELINDSTIRATWTIVDGYYIYRDKVSFESATPGITLDKVVLPTGKKKQGLTPEGKEGLVEVYLNKLSVDIPLQRSNAALTELKLIGKSQGCSEKFGICYPPQKREKALKLTAAKPGATSSAVSQIGSLSSQLGIANDAGPLPAEQAFAVSAVVAEGNILRVTWTMASDYYMYRDKFKFESGTAGVTLGDAKYPPGKMHHGITPEGKEGEVEVYFEQVVIDVPYTNSTGNAIQFNLIAHGQGCAEKLGICYPPQKRTIAMDLPAGGDGLSATDILWRLLIAFGSGFLLTFTPCVLPMLPILCSIIIGQGQNVSRARCAGLSSTYVFGTTVVWTIAGVVAGATGQQLQAYTSHPYFVIPVAVVLVLLALAMFGIYNLQMPASLQSRAQEKSGAVKSGTYTGVFFMGVLGSIIAGACVSPILILNLGVALDTHSPVLGGAIMFLMAVGMGVPIIMIGMGAGWLLPKAGGWMDTVKYAFGVILIGLAIYVVTPVGSIPVMYLWAALLIATGAIMGMFQKSAFPSRPMQITWKIIAVLLIVWGALAFHAARQGERNIFFNPLSATAQHTKEVHLFTRVTKLADIEKLLMDAKAQNKPAMLDYYATWCTDCNIMERTVFADAAVQKLLQEKFVLVQADVTDQFDPNTQPMKEKFGVFGPPAMLFFDKQGNEHRELRRYGKMSKEEFMALIAPLL